MAVVKPPRDPPPDLGTRGQAWAPWQQAILARFVAWVGTLDLDDAADAAMLEAYTAQLQRLASANGRALQQAYARHDGRN